MAEEVVHEGKTLKEMEKEITCAICQEHYTEPKVLPCLHYYCRQCILRLALRVESNKPFSCPECREETTLPEGGVDELKTAFFVNRLKPMFSMLERTHSKVEVKCEACTESGGKAEAFCRQCARFVCNECIKLHRRMKPLDTHEIASLDDLKHGRTKPIVPSEPSTRKCLVHEEPLIIYCFDCDSLICHLCTVKDHRDHNFEFCKKAAATTKEKLLEELKPLIEVRASLSHAVEEITTTKQEVVAQGDSVVNTIQTSFKNLHEVLHTREQELLKEAERRVQEKVEKLSTQVKNLSLLSAEVQGIEDCTERCVRHCVDNEVMSMYTGIRKRIERGMEQHSKPVGALEPVEEADMGAEVSCIEDLQHLCQTKSRIITFPAKFVVSMEESKQAEVSKTFEVKLTKMNKLTQENQNVISYVKSLSTGAITKCNVDRTGTATYSIKYTPTSRGHHELTVSVNGQEVAGSPFPVLVSFPPSQLQKPVKVLDVQLPCGIAVNSVGDVIVAQYEGDIIKYDKDNQREVLVKYSQTTLKVLRDITLDNEDNIYCIDEQSNKILKCNKNGSNILIKEVKKMTNGYRGLAVAGNEVFISEQNTKGTIMVCNRELEYMKHIKHGSMGQPAGISVDNYSTLYVTDATHGRIVVFSNDGTFLHSFGCDGNGKKVLKGPCGICVSGHYVYVTDVLSNSVSVFTNDGAYVTSFGKYGADKGNFSLPLNVCVDRDSFVLITDYLNNRVQIF